MREGKAEVREGFTAEYTKRRTLTLGLPNGGLKTKNTASDPRKGPSYAQWPEPAVNSVAPRAERRTTPKPHGGVTTTIFCVFKLLTSNEAQCLGSGQFEAETWVGDDGVGQLAAVEPVQGVGGKRRREDKVRRDKKEIQLVYLGHKGAAEKRTCKKNSALSQSCLQMVPPDDNTIDIMSDLTDEDENTTPMDAVKRLVTEKPELGKWFVSSPELMKKQEKNQKAKERRANRKRKADEETDDVAPAAKKGRKGKDKAIADDAGEEPAAILTAYIRLIKPSPPPSSSRSRSKPKPETLYIQRGPVQFSSTCSLDEFLFIVAQALPCAPGSIIQAKTEWKPQTPANRPMLPLGGTIGFAVLQEQISKSKDKTVIVCMPGPQKPAEDAPFWDLTGVDGVGAQAGPSKLAGVVQKGFDFDELEATNVADSVAEQKMSFDKAVAPHIEDLKDRWPENEKGVRVYTDDKGYQWELNTIRLSVWGAHLARGSATLDKAPVSAQFDIKNHIKTQAPAVAPPNLQPLIPVPAQNPVPSQTDKLLEMMTMSLMLQHQQQQHHLTAPLVAPIAVAPAPAPAAPVHAPLPVVSAPPSPAKPNHRPVSLAEFCAHYEIPQYFERLEKLEYEPGDNGIKSLEREDWQNVAGFSRLAWEKVLLKHKTFIADVCAGLWA
ncbi:hypothetical protein C8R46DRAFT_1025906 [Mycena filopes]|nr:hypothetical protein C8R46DRAFT_1025906 [Mycena filopes]